MGQNARDLSRDIAVDEKLNPQTSAWLGSNYEEYKKLDEQGLVDKPNVGQAENQQADKQDTLTKEPKTTRQAENLSQENHHQNQGDNKKPQPTTPKSDSINGVSGSVKASETTDKADNLATNSFSVPKYLQKPTAQIGETSVNNQSAYKQVALKEVQVSNSKNETSLLDNATNFFAGVGDIVSFGATKWVRNRFDIGNVDYQSKYYKGGEVAGVAVGVVATGGSAAVRTGVAKAVSGTVNTVSTVGKVSAGLTGVGIAADARLRSTLMEFNHNIKYDEKMCNALYTLDKYKNNDWGSGNNPLTLNDIGKEHDFLDNVAKVPREVNGVDLAYFLMAHRFASSAGKTGLSLGKFTQAPVGLMGVVGLDAYSVGTAFNNTKGQRISELRTDLKGTLMGYHASFYKDIKSFADAQCHKPKKGKK